MMLLLAVYQYCTLTAQTSSCNISTWAFRLHGRNTMLPCYSTLELHQDSKLSAWLKSLEQYYYSCTFFFVEGGRNLTIPNPKSLPTAHSLYHLVISGMISSEWSAYLTTHSTGRRSLDSQWSVINGASPAGTCTYSQVVIVTVMGMILKATAVVDFSGESHRII